MRVGIWLGSTPPNSIGGGFSYFDKLLSRIETYNFPEKVEIVYLCYHSNGKHFNREVCEVGQIPAWIFRCFGWSKLLTKVISKVDRGIVRLMGLEKALAPYGVKLVYYPTQTCCVDTNFPFISNNWDIGHLSTYAFPEVSSYKKNFEYRNRFYQQWLPKALLTVCESETGKQELLKYTPVGEHKIRIMPIFAGEVTSISVKEDELSKILKEKGLTKLEFFFYPAQFWAHKNHYNLLKAFKAFSEKHPSYKLVLSGSDQGNLAYVKSLVEEYGLKDKVVFLGFVSIETIYTMYKCATSLIMASHFGPTNMPPIEAMEIGCPVICSDLGGHREILGGAALYFYSFDSQALLDCMEEMCTNRSIYIEKLKKQKQVTAFNVDNAMKQFVSIISEAVEIRSNWG